MKTYGRPPVTKNSENVLNFLNTSVDVENEKLRIFGVNEEGNSVCVKITDFRPYFYALKLPENDFDIYTELTKTLQHTFPKDQEPFVLKIEEESKLPIMGYHPHGEMKMHKITVEQPKYVVTCRSIFQNRNIPTYEASILYVLRFMIDLNFGGYDWLQINNCVPINYKETSCQIEVQASYTDLVSKKERLDINPHVRILFFDLEVLKKGRGFAGPSVDPIIIISNVLCNVQYKTIDNRLFVLVEPGKNIAALPAHIHVELFENLPAMLLRWTEYVRECDPEILSGYNIDGYDFNYLFEQAKAQRIGFDFAKFGRVLEKSCTIRSSTFQSAASGTRTDYEVNMDGRFSFDMLKFAKAGSNMLKLRSYTLNNVLQHLLKKNKVEMPYKLIPTYYHGTDEQRKHLCNYAWYDSEACREIMENQITMTTYTESARVCAVPMKLLLTRGQQILTMSLLVRYSKRRNILIPTTTESQNDEETDGATVLEPKRGFHNDPVITLDYQSLYPSIIRDKNICYSTKVPLAWAKQNLKPDQYHVPPNIEDVNFAFVSEDIFLGVLNEVETDLFNLRLKAKADMANEKDPQKKAMFNKRQNELKLRMNSIYGFTKAQMLCDKDLMSAVTAYGRYIIDTTKKLVEEAFPGCEVIYGDTDSVFVKFPGKTMEEAFALGQQAADMCTAFLNKERRAQGKEDVHKLQREKGFYVLLIVGKKKYAGSKIEKLTDKPKLAVSGMEKVRRDNALIGSETQEKCLQMLIMEGDHDGERSIAFVHEQIRLLLKGQIEMSKLIISKNISKSFEHYEKSKSKQPHIQLRTKIEQRKHKTGEVGYHVGDRVKYVIIKQLKGTNSSDCAEDPMYALQNRLEIDYEYYITNQMMKPLLRIFTPLLAPNVNLKTVWGKTVTKDKEDMTKLNKSGKKVYINEKELHSLTSYKRLFVGPHMMSKRQKVGGSEGIMKFAQKLNSCLRCGCSLANQNETSCKSCKPVERLTFLTLEDEMNTLKLKRANCWKTCQTCVGEHHTTIECTNNDCSNFYERDKVNFDIEDLDIKLQRFIKKEPEIIKKNNKRPI